MYWDFSGPCTADMVPKNIHGILEGQDTPTKTSSTRIFFKIFLKIWKNSHFLFLLVNYIKYYVEKPLGTPADKRILNNPPSRSKIERVKFPFHYGIRILNIVQVFWEVFGYAHLKSEFKTNLKCTRTRWHPG